MRQLGIVMRLDEAIFAPEVVKQVLNGQAVLDHSVSEVSCWYACLFRLLHVCAVIVPYLLYLCS